MTTSGRITSRSPGGGRQSQLPASYQTIDEAQQGMDNKVDFLCSKKGYHLATPGVTAPISIMRKASASTTTSKPFEDPYARSFTKRDRSKVRQEQPEKVKVKAEQQDDSEETTNKSNKKIKVANVKVEE
ncbi:hypothetical protein TrST_g13335 [Triparma strigata]|uniref:Uncharacterized protein n=1 Tax=Triparma strigata TaxID=1606541 RepID=A0A9W7EUI9_9STRA|nr:hypothetical protein TrST_g13335 [Triparma strigata]